VLTHFGDIMGRPAAIRKSEMVEATLRLMVDVGPDRVTTAAVAAAVGISQAALFRHFPRKADLWMAVLDWLTGETAEGRWRVALAIPGTALDRLRALLLGQLDLIARTPAVPALLFSRELHVENEALRAGLAGLMERFQGHLRDLVAEAEAEGRLNPAVDPDAVSRLLASLVPGTATRWSLTGHRFDIVSEGQQALEIVLAGLIAKERR
jgi:TetR/AcrR family transcriptional regulator